MRAPAARQRRAQTDASSVEKEPYISEKEPYIPAKEPCIPAKYRQALGFLHSFPEPGIYLFDYVYSL